jgi:hypothetical protein
MKILTTILLLAAMPALADTITTISGTTYSDAKVTKTTPTAISITHSSGFRNPPRSGLFRAKRKCFFETAARMCCSASVISRS